MLRRSELSDDTPKSDTPNAETDSLETLKNDLLELEQKFQKHLKYWREKKLEIIKTTEITLPDPEKEIEKKEDGILDQFQNLLKQLYADIEFPNQNLKHLLDKQAELNAICEKLMADCKELPANDAEKEKEISLEVCDKSIEDVEALLEIINAIKVEIEFCVESEKAVTEGFLWLTRYLINFLTHDNPDFDLKLISLQREMLYNNVIPVVNEIYDKMLEKGEAIEEVSKQKLETIPGKQISDSYFSYNYWFPAKKQAVVETPKLAVVEPPKPEVVEPPKAVEEVAKEKVETTPVANNQSYFGKWFIWTQPKKAPVVETPKVEQVEEKKPAAPSM